MPRCSTAVEHLGTAREKKGSNLRAPGFNRQLFHLSYFPKGQQQRCWRRAPREGRTPSLRRTRTALCQMSFQGKQNYVPMNGFGPLTTGLMGAALWPS